MPNRGQLGGLAFELPDNRFVAPTQPLPAAPEQGAVPFFGLPKEDDDLAYVEGLTDMFYDTRGKIEAYATDMWNKYGVDVTQPDYTSRGGGIPFKTYQKLATDLKIIANDLGNSQKRQGVIDQGIASGQIQTVQGFNPTEQPISRMNPNEMFFSTRLLPEVAQANDILKTAVYTEADHKRFKEQVADPLIARLTEEMNRPGITQGEKERLQFNIDALVQQPRTTPYAAFQGQYNGRKSTVEIDLLKKVTNAAQGKWAPGTYTPSTDEQGNPVLVSKQLEGEQAGEYVFEDAKGNQKRVARVIDGLVKKQDGVYFTFKQGEGVEIPPVKVSSQKGDEITSKIISSNPKYGSVTKMYEAMREMGLSDETGSLVNEKVLAGDDFNTPDPTAFGAGIEAEKQRIISELRKTTEGGFQIQRKTFSVDLPDGSTITFKPNRIGSGWYVSDGGESSDNMNEQDIIKLLAKEKYFDQFLTQKPNTTLQEEVVNQLQTPSSLATVPELQPLPNETQAQYDLRLIKFRRSQKK